MYLADFLSRSPVWRGSEEQKLREMMKTDIFSVKRSRLLCPLVDDGRFQSLLTAAKNDNNYQLLIQALEEGRTDRQQLLGAYSKNVSRMELMENQGAANQLVSMEGRIVIPDSWVSEALSIVHSHHLGADLTLQNARSLYWWPDQKTHIKNAVESCQACARHQRLAPELPWMRPSETYFETGPNFRHCIDMFTILNEKVMLISDWWSGMTWVKNFGRHPTTKDVTDWLEHLYMLQGAPSYIRHDGGEQFRSKWSQWCTSMGIKSQCSSAFTPTSNGFSENQVGITKRALLKMVESGVITSVKDNLQLSRGLCRLMMTPRVNGLSAADMFYGRKVRSPLYPNLIEIGKCRLTDKQWENLCTAKEHRRATALQQGPKGRKSGMQLKFKNDYILETDNTAELKIGDKCLVYDVRRGIWAREAVVCEVRPSGRSYWVKECSTGRKLLRSRRHLRRRKSEGMQDCLQGAVKKVAATKETTSDRPASPTPTSPPAPSAASSTHPPAPKRVSFAIGTKRNSK